MYLKMRRKEPCWIELKTAKEPPMENRKLFGNRQRGLEVEQENWLLTHEQAGGRGWVMVMTDRHLILFDGAIADRINNLSMQEVPEAASGWWHRAGIDWERVAEGL